MRFITDQRLVLHDPDARPGRARQTREEVRKAVSEYGADLGRQISFWLERYARASQQRSLRRSQRACVSGSPDDGELAPSHLSSGEPLWNGLTQSGCPLRILVVRLPPRPRERSFLFRESEPHLLTLACIEGPRPTPAVGHRQSRALTHHA